MIGGRIANGYEVGGMWGRVSHGPLPRKLLTIYCKIVCLDAFSVVLVSGVLVISILVALRP